jgi:outer membrane immunogenic protein
MKIWSLGLIAGISALALSQPAAAADYAAARAAYDWAGAYIGGHAGYGSGHNDADAVSLFLYPSGSLGATLPGFGIDTHGFIGGAEAGYGWQAGGLYLGVEADVSATGVKGTHTDEVNGFKVDSTLSWLSTARVRVGLPLDRFLVFASAGLAVGGLRGDLHDNYVGPLTINSSTSSTSVGWTAGAGVAAAITDHWSIKAEYLYADLGSRQYGFAEPDGPLWSLISTRARTTVSIGRVALDYRF